MQLGNLSKANWQFYCNEIQISELESFFRARFGSLTRLRTLGVRVGAVNIPALSSIWLKREDSETPRVVATLEIFWKLKLLSPRSIVPMNVRWTRHLSANASWE